jgi:hypothetical protein
MSAIVFVLGLVVLVVAFASFNKAEFVVNIYRNF